MGYLVYSKRETMASFDFWIDVWPIFVALYEVVKAFILFPFPKSRRSLEGEVALVTGAGSGLGRGTAYLLAEKGCSVVCWDMNEAENEKTVNYIRKTLGKESYGFKVDVLIVTKSTKQRKNQKY